VQNIGTFGRFGLELYLAAYSVFIRVVSYELARNVIKCRDRLEKSFVKIYSTIQ